MISYLLATCIKRVADFGAKASGTGAAAGSRGRYELNRSILLKSSRKITKNFKW